MFIPTALQGLKSLYTAFNRPKSIMPEETMSAINRMISNNEADIKSKTLLNMLTSTAKSQGAQQYQQGKRSLDVLLNRGDVSEGQYAKGLQGIATDIQGNLGEQTKNAVLEQYKSNQNALDKIEQARLQIAQIKDSMRQQLSQQRQEWGAELAGNVLDTATSGFNTYVQGIEDKDIRDTIDNYMTSIGNKPFGQMSIAEQQGLLTALLMKKYGKFGGGK